MWLLLLGMNQAPKANVHWSEVTYSPDCFFFSGPQHLGRDDHLGELAVVSLDGARVVDFGTARFEGPLSGSRISRRSVHDFGGPWTVLETFEGSWGSDHFEGRYSYQEQAEDSAPGSCAIHADVIITYGRNTRK